jgi:hypothetical protein
VAEYLAVFRDAEVWGTDETQWHLLIAAASGSEGADGFQES